MKPQTYFDIHPNLPVIDMIASVGLIRQTSSGGAPTKSGDVQPEYRCNVDRNGRVYNFHAYEAAKLALAFARLPMIAKAEGGAE